MKIKLVQSGGILGLNKEAETDVDWTKAEADNLISKISVEGNKTPVMPDTIGYTLEMEGREIPVDVSKATGKYAVIFGDLKKNLKIVKR